MRTNNYLFILKAIGIVYFSLFLYGIVNILLEWYQLDLKKTWDKSFFENSFLSLRSAVCLVVLSTAISVLSPLSPVYALANLGKLMVIEALLIGMIVGGLYLHFSLSYNLVMPLYESTFTAMLVGGAMGVTIPWLVRLVFFILFHRPRYFMV